MDKTEQALFEAYAVLDAHVGRMHGILRNAPNPEDYLENLKSHADMVAQATAKLLALPRPPKQVAKAA